jgi:triacylglycerol lipase
MAPGLTPVPSTRPPTSGVHERPEPPPIPRSYRTLRSLEAVGREAVALARQATLFHRDVTVVIPSARSGDHVAVFVHGLFATAGVLRPLRAQIEAGTGALTSTFTYAPGPCVQSIAERLAEIVRGLPEDVRIHLIGHSVGGIVSRWFVQELGGDPRVVQTISIGSPFHGTTKARLFPAPIGRDIMPGSALLARLSTGRLNGVPHLSIAGSDDQVVPTGAMFPLGEGLMIDGCGHNGLVYHPTTLSTVLRRIRTVQAAAAACDAWSSIG